MPRRLHYGFELPEQTPPASPASGFVALYAKSGGRVCIKGDDGTETDLGAAATKSELAAEASLRESEDNSIRDAIDNAIQTRAWFRSRPITGNTTAEFGDIIYANAASAPIAVTGPTSGQDAPTWLIKTDSSPNAVTFTPASGLVFTIGGNGGAANLQLIEQGEAAIIGFDFTNWWVL